MSKVSRLGVFGVLAAVSVLVGCQAPDEPGEEEGQQQQELGEDPEGQDCETEGEMIDCEVDGVAGVAFCQLEPSTNELFYGACGPQDSSGSTPLVIAFDGASVEFTQAPGTFAVDPTMTVGTDWVSAKTPWLALDRNGNGRIDDGGELFGSATRLASGAFATNGFEALAELDGDGDGVITPNDAAWSALVLWSDADGDRASSSDELVSLSARGLSSLGLGYDVSKRCDARGNCEVETAPAFLASSAAGEARVVDVHFRHQR